ncbi:L7Ae/L30e/S12e/Gadd45 family ribosomal protein [Caldinitratiruptor microaerophilus]|uniref:Ribosomal protein eL8/eL30/eS12/Gadd45 domain-containing protein n=1 Tax=Caldinitratiruptor microaerophilus TaxID=671077 RepID=A0AA35G5H1_9FIRM|nr:ribosomal L7Ae/L30e/S12e/Gadd45 family protein [Caldinitratiruptor microaerophilus]BDG59401.1 hypothetical protein caldi_04910 [Caldinitratiruptor microaerophilus]
MLPRQVGQLLGLCRRAGVLLAGERAVRAALGRRTLGLVLLAEDAGANATRRYAGLGGRVPVYVAGTRQELGAAVGLSPRAVLGVAAGPLGDRLAAALSEAGLAPAGVPGSRPAGAQSGAGHAPGRRCPLQ